MPTFTALTTLEGKEPAEALGTAMEGMDPAPIGVGVFEIEDGSGLWEVGGYFEAVPSEAELAVLAAAFDAKPFAVSELPETDWVAKVKRELAPVEAGRFFVYGSHDADKVPEGRVALLIEAAMAFGTGHHGTTLGCLRAYDRALEDGRVPERVADVGCGTAVLAMAAAATSDAIVVAGDLDPVAVDVARANLEANGLADRVTCAEAAGFDALEIAAAGPFDLIFANILMAPLIDLAPDMAAHLATGGRAILSGLLREQGDEVAAVYARHGMALVGREDLGEWCCLVVERG